MRKQDTAVHWELDGPNELRAPFSMATPAEENFNDYKRAEKKALEILAAMKAVTPRKVDIELALLVAIFELHRGALPSEQIGAVVQGHLKVLVQHYAGKPAG